jgi:hypothetical protein
MKFTKTVTLREMLTTARDLTEPGEVNEEYVRGQAGLICDTFGLLGSDEYSQVVILAITHEVTVAEAVTAIMDVEHIPAYADKIVELRTPSDSYTDMLAALGFTPGDEIMYGLIWAELERRGETEAFG